MSEPNACLLREQDKPLFDLGSLDLSTCGVLEVNTALNEFERARPNVSHRFDSWPADVQKRVNDIVKAWIEKNPKRVIRMQSSSIWQGVAVLVLHHAAE